MHILVDLLSLGFGGSETYPLEILPRLSTSSHSISVLLYQGAGDQLRRIPNVSVIDAPNWARHPFMRHLYQRFFLPKLLIGRKVQVLFIPGGLSGTPNLLNHKIRRISMLRNMLPFDTSERERYSMFDYPWMRFRLKLLSMSLLRSFRSSDRIIFISNYSASIVGPSVASVDRRVIPHGVAEIPDKCTRVEVLRKYNVPERYLLYASIIDPYKHQDAVINGVANLPDDTPQLVLAGPIVGAYGARVSELAVRLNGRVLLLGAVPRSELAVLMQNATLLLFGSTCETCPNILLEYMQAGRAIVCSSSQPMPEFGSDCVRYVNAGDPKQWASVISELLNSNDLQNSLACAAQARAKNYTWDITATETLKALTEW